MHVLEMIAIIGPDKSFDKKTFMTELEKKTEYQAQIAELKALNGWNQPIE